MRHILLIATGLILTLGPAAAQAPTATLKREVVVTSDIVRIGDLIEHAGGVAGTAIFRSPDLGETGRVDVRRIIEAVRPYGLVSIDTQDLTEVVVVRPGRVIGIKEIEAAIARALDGRYGLGEAANLQVTIERDARPIHVEPSAPAELQPARVSYDRISGRFDVSLALPGSATARGVTLRYIGTVVETRPVAVLVRALARGETVKAGDVTLERRPKASLGDDSTVALEAAVGLAARRALRAGQPLRQGDLGKPELVQKNETVTLIYEIPGVVLTIRGKAIDSGAAGDLVNVLNIQSKRTVQGTVIGPGRVSIGPGAPQVTVAAVSSTQPEAGNAERRPSE